ncbi:MAG: cation transporter [Hyphomonadaceae bacterium]|nr:cation transporter [Hyphomonadaceae bacterium]
MSKENYTADAPEQRRTLWIVLALNIGLAAMLAIGGALADSSGLFANALDNASDAAVYALSLVVIGRSLGWKRAAAIASGILLILFALGVLADTARRYFYGSEPIGPAMIALAVIAAIINLMCLQVLKRLDSDEVHIGAARTFSFNDFIANGGIIVAGILVLSTGERWPDLVAGLAVTAIALKGAFEIFDQARDASEAKP